VSSPLLVTKMRVPPLRSSLVRRSRLTERLDRVLDPGCKLGLVSAPAGYGKTTLLSAWAAHCGSNACIAWVSLGQGDNTAVDFWAYVIAALWAIHADMRKGDGDVHEPLQAAPSEAALVALINQMAQVTAPVVLVIDDYHVIDAPAIHRALAFFLENMPRHMHVVLATRADPPLPIPRLRGRGQLVELYESDLRFEPDEAAEFLERVVGLRLRAHDLAVLEQRTEGWVAGLQLAAISMRGHEDISAFVQAFAGSHRYIFDYLADEVLRQQTAEVQAFLLQTAILDRLSGELCDAVRGHTGRTGGFANSQAVLEYLEGNNLFIVPLDEERRWFRYHHLFADLLRQRLQRSWPERLPALHGRASAWYEQQGQTTQAIGHALAAQDFGRAADLAERVGWSMLIRGACTTLLGWLDALPAALVRSRPQLGVFRAWCLTVTGQGNRADRSLSDFDGQVQTEAAAVLAYSASLKGDPRGGVRFARQALEQLAEDATTLRGFLSMNLGIALYECGDVAPAGCALNQAIVLSHATDQIELALAATATLGHVQETQGQLSQAVATHRKVLDLGLARDDGPPPVVGMANLGIAEVLYEWNDLEQALRQVNRGFELLIRGQFVSFLLFGHSLRARLCLANGDLDGAQKAILQAEQLAQPDEFVYMSAVLAALRVRMVLATGDLAAAGRWAQAHRWDGSGEVDRMREAEQMAVARVLLAQGDPSEAMRLLKRLLGAAQRTGRMGAAVRILVLQALSLQAGNDLGGALDVLGQALALAESEGYVRTFLDEGEPMARLLREALSRGIVSRYASRLLAAFEKASVSPATARLIEPLSERETEVLRLIVAGLSNGEIAAELVIATSTVKSHINSIYGKLGVVRRTQAVAKAQEMDLL